VPRDAQDPAGRPRVQLPAERLGPVAVLGRRLAVAVGLIVFVAVAAYIGRDGYRDSAGGEIGILDALYYATVSITTTGYGDIVPVTDGARLLTTLVVTPVRVLFLILLVGTTLELLAERTRDAVRERIWRQRLKDHVIVCGYGTKGRKAVEVLVRKGTDIGQVVAIDTSPDAVERANADGVAIVHGNAATTETLHAAGIRDARAVVVAPPRDDTSVLVTLTARELNDRATIVAAVREEENVHLLRESGANSVITSSSAAGRLLGLATETPRLVEVLEDLLSVGEGLDIVERAIGPDEAGPRTARGGDELVVAIVRNGEMLRFDHPDAQTLQQGDRVLCLCSHDER
jgi:voltage-gated potassium channel